MFRLRCLRWIQAILVCTVVGAYGGSSGGKITKYVSLSRHSHGEYESGDNGSSAGTSNDKGELGPSGLLLRGLRRTPLYTEIFLVSSLGMLAGVCVNVGARRFVRRDGGFWWLLGALLSWCFAIVLTCLIG